MEKQYLLVGAVAGGAVGASVVAVGPALGQPQPRSNYELRMDNPISKYPSPPFRNKLSHGPAWHAIWIQSPTTARAPISVPDG